jgi:hypothetical protein
MAQQIVVSIQPIERTVEPRLAEISELLNRMNLFSEALARRAFEIFEGRGGQHRCDLDDWLRAEKELFHTAHLDVADLGQSTKKTSRRPAIASEAISPAAPDPYNSALLI